MMYNANQVINGLIKYADSEVMTKLPVSGKWIMGTAINLASDKINNVVETLANNSAAKMLGIVDENGNIDADALIEAMRASAEKYGKMTIEVPIIGKLTFSSADVDMLKTYIS